MSLDAARIGERKGDARIGGARLADRAQESRAVFPALQQIGFQIDRRGRLDAGGRHILRSEFLCRAEFRAHGPLAVRGHQDQHPAGGEALFRGGRHHAVFHPRRLEIVHKDLSEAVRYGLSRKARPRAEAGEGGDGVGGRAAGGCAGLAHGCVDLPGAVGIDQRHHALAEPQISGERGIDLFEHIDQCRAHGQHLEAPVGVEGESHAVLLSQVQRSRMRHPAQSGVRALQT